MTYPTSPPRAWHKKDKKMYWIDAIYWDVGELDSVWIVDKDSLSDEDRRCNPADVLLMFPTDLHDKHGKEEVYHKDIISYSISQTQHYKGVVEWDENDCEFVIKAFWQKLDPWGRYPKSHEGFCSEVHGLNKGVFDIEILGNVHEHPALLEEHEQD